MGQKEINGWVLQDGKQGNIPCVRFFYRNTYRYTVDIVDLSLLDLWEIADKNVHPSVMFPKG